MKPNLLLATLTVLAAVHPAPAQAPKTERINPALLYWQAAAQAPRLNDAQAQKARAIATGRQPWTAADAQDLNLGQAESLLRLASASPEYCDWGLPLSQGPLLALPHIAKMNELSMLALVHAEGRFTENHPEEGREWLIIAHRMARHTGSSRLLISCLVQFSQETHVINAIARRCAEWDEPTRQALAEQLQLSPPAATVNESMPGELTLLNWIEGILELPEPERQRKLQQLPDFAIKDASAESDQLSAQWQLDAMREAIAESRANYQKSQALLAKPWNESHAELEALGRTAQQQRSALVTNFYAVVSKVFLMEAKVQTLRTMLGAALRHGPQIDEARAGQYQDAFHRLPLRLITAADGARKLAMNELAPDGKPVELPLGR